jgi:hypothetical protein
LNFQAKPPLGGFLNSKTQASKLPKSQKSFKTLQNFQPSNYLNQDDNTKLSKNYLNQKLFKPKII